MKRILITGTLALFIVFTGCLSKQVPLPKGAPQTVKSTTQPQAVKPTAQPQTVKPTARPQAMKAAKATPRAKKTVFFTLAQLKKFNGQNGSRAYAAVNGIVYDVTNAGGWRNGKHYSGVTAGKDLSKTILASPHGTSVLNGLPIVGKLKK